MKNIIVSTALVFLVNLILQVSIDYFLDQEKGQILILEPIAQNDTTYHQNIIISNYQSSSLKNIELFITEGRVKSLHSNKRENKHSIQRVGTDKFVIETLYANSNIVIDFEISISSKSTKPTIVPLNHKDLDLSVKSSQESLEPRKIMWLSVLINCSSIALLFAFFTYYQDQRINNLKKHNKKIKDFQNERSIDLEQRVNDRSSELKRARSEVKELQSTWAKARILLLNQIRDLKKENDFYRRITELLVKRISPKVRIKDLEDIITSQLKTFSTKGNITKELQNIDIIASFFDRKNYNK